MSDPIVDRIWNAIPVTQQAFIKLLDLLEIRESREVDSAAVTLGARSRLLVNPDFVAEHCPTDDRLAMLVLHELFHVLLGHTRLYERVTPLQNFVFDAVINAHLCNLFPMPGYTALFRTLYRNDGFPEALLRPPNNWRSKHEEWGLEGEALRVHQALYTQSSVTYQELFDLLEHLLGGDEELVRGVPLVGGHGQDARDGENHGEGADPDFIAEVRRIIAKWPMDRPKSGRDQGLDAAWRQVQVEKARADAVRKLRKAVVEVLDRGANGHCTVRNERAAYPTVVPYRTGKDRRAVVGELLGQVPLFDLAPLEQASLVHRERVHVYLDVSGSVEGLLPLLLGVVLPLQAYLNDQIHLFSTRVVDVPFSGLRKGDITTTGGTDIICVTEHMLENRVRRAVLITDGWVGNVPEEHALRLRKNRVRVNSVILEGGDADYASALRGKVHYLPKLIDEPAA